MLVAAVSATFAATPVAAFFVTTHPAYTRWTLNR